MGTKSRVGQYGLIPEDMYLRKIEETEIFEDPDQVESYQRQLLQNRRPDPYLFESDAPRINSESRNILNIRYGGYRTNIDPYLPDGTFLDYEHFNKDPRSHMVDPDFSKAKDQQYARGALTNYYPDNDDSIPGQGINPLDLQERIVNTIYRVKDYKKIFDTSFDSRSTKAFMPKFEGHCKDIALVDQEIADLNAATCANRADATTKLSNETQIGWWTDIDTRFKVAKYGQVRPTKGISENWNRTMREAKPTQKMLGITYEGINLTRDVAMKMINHIARKDMLHQTGRHTLFGLGTTATNRARKATSKDIWHLIQQSAMRPAQHMYEDQTIERPAMIPHVDQMLHAKVIVNPQIVEFISEVMQKRTSAPRQVADLRNSIMQSALDRGVYMQNMNSKSASPMTDIDQNRRDSHETQTHVDITKIKHYEGLKPPASLGHENVRFEHYQAPAQEHANLQAQQVHEAQTAAGYVGDMKGSKIEGLTKNRYARGLGSKNLRGATQYEPHVAEQEDMTDIEALTRF